MNFAIPPKESLKKSIFYCNEEGYYKDNKDFSWGALHPDYKMRRRFYETYLVPTGHAKLTTYGGWEFSREYYEAMINELSTLQALIKLIL